MMNIRMLLIGILILYGSCAGLALKCYVCTNLVHGTCYNNPGSFLKECPPGITECTLEIKIDKDPYVFRDCMIKDWKCKYDRCKTCTEEGCNSVNEIEDDSSNPNIAITPMELVMANIYVIGATALVVVLLLIWVITKACSKSKDDDDDDYDDEDYEYDEEEYDDDDSIEKEYDEYSYEAEQEYQNEQQISEDSV